MKKIKMILDNCINKHKKTFLKLFNLHFFTLVTCTVILVLSLINFSPDIEGPKIPYFDKVVHFFLYFCLMFVYIFEKKFTVLKFNKKHLLIYFKGLMYCLVFGAGIEFIQGLTSYRSAEFYDFVADFFGAICGIMVYYLRDRLFFSSVK